MERLVRHCTDNLLPSVTLCFIAGASGAAFVPSPLDEQPSIVFAALALAILTVLPLLYGSATRPLAALPFFLLTGFVHTHLALQPITDPDHIAAIVTGPTKVTLIGRMLTMAEYTGERTRFELDGESLLIHDPARQSAFRPVRGKVLLSVQGALDPQFSPGKTIMAIATVDRIRNYQTPGAFDSRLQMATKSIYCSGWIQSPREILPVEEPHRPVWHTLRFLPEQTRQLTSQFLEQRLDREIAGLYQALLVGSMSNVSPQRMEEFKENGCFHVLAISGLHLSLLGLFCVTLFSWLLKRSTWLLLHTHVPTLALLLTSPILLFYAFVAGFNVPAIRALATALLVLFAVILRRQRSMVHLIAAAALLVLAMTPLALFTPSFQLSFAAVLAINLIYPRLPLRIDRHNTAARQETRLVHAFRAIQSMFYVSLAATAGTLPILLYHFNRFSLIGPVMNLAIEPLLCLWALPCGLLAILLIPIWPDLAQFILHAGQPGIQLALWLTKTVAGLPHASVWTITPNMLEIALFFLALFLLLGERQTLRHRTLAVGVLLLLAGSFTLPLWYKRNNGELTVSFLDVGQGSSTVVRFPDGTTLLVDGGGYQTEQFDPGQNLIAPFLWRNRIWRLDGLIVTHPHQDHYNGLPFVAARFRPRRVFVNGDSGETPDYDRLLTAVRDNGATVQVAQTGDILFRRENLTLQCMGMNGLLQNDSPWSTNDRSLVLRLHYGEQGFLFPADIGGASEHRLTRSGVSLASEVLLAPHHGSASSAGEELIAAVDPALIVVSASHRRQDMFPAPEHLNRWRQKKICVLTTAQEGTITCRTDGKHLRANTFAGKRFVLAESDRLFWREK